mmetsp:Transcript_21103/g.27373  ORF Transcript_21103/g.27373 Transcript_21103/m.27373 type:complete len:224 (+) Transcript_21103:77-748(+)
MTFSLKVCSPILLFISLIFLLANGRDETCLLTEDDPANLEYPLQFCHMYPDTTCCLLAHDGEIEGYYLDMLDIGGDCSREITDAKDAIRTLFCLACSPLQPKYTNSSNEEIFICKSLAEKIFPTYFDDCGIVVPAARGDDCAGDDTIVPGAYYGSGIAGAQRFLDDNGGAKPVYFENWTVTIVDDSSDNHVECYTGSAMSWKGGLAFTSIFLFLCLYVIGFEL